MTAIHRRTHHPRTLEALAQVPRASFDAGVPQTREPRDRDVLATMLDALELQGTERVLCIGCGSGYLAAVLGQLAREVDCVELEESCAARESYALANLGCTNVHMVPAKALTEVAEAATYQGILVAAASPELPTVLLGHLEVGGRLVIPLGDAEEQLLERMQKREDGLLSETLGTCRFAPLPGLRATPSVFPWTTAHKD